MVKRSGGGKSPLPAGPGTSIGQGLPTRALSGAASAELEKWKIHNWVEETASLVAE